MNEGLKAFLLVFFSLVAVGTANEPRNINIHNDSKNKVEIYWIHPYTKEEVLQSNPFIYSGATFALNSFVGHSFEAREMPGKSGKCAGEDDTCRVGYFTVNENDEQVIFINDEFRIKHQDNVSVARESAAVIIDECKKDALSKIEAGEKDPEDVVEFVSSCISDSVAVEMELANEEIAFQAGVRKKMAEHYENYTCADYDLPSTEPVETTKWYFKGKKRDVKVLLDRPSSKIHVVDNFITPEECAAMENEAAKTLHRATVADGKGGSELSPSRKAMQAGIKIPWSKEKDGDPLTTISRRVYDYTNHVLHMNIKENGQEDLMSIQYEGRGSDDTEPDRYKPHCDGDCNGMDFKQGNRMATMVMYCTVPTKGGATNFRNSGVHVVPQAGSATFFSYINPDNFKMDNGFTEHSGCPVVEGEKKIVTQWIRYGVDDENPWDSYNTLGIKYSEMED